MKINVQKESPLKGGLIHAIMRQVLEELAYIYTSVECAVEIGSNDIKLAHLQFVEIDKKDEIVKSDAIHNQGMCLIVMNT